MSLFKKPLTIKETKIVTIRDPDNLVQKLVAMTEKGQEKSQEQNCIRARVFTRFIDAQDVVLNKEVLKYKNH
jgi:hypothetical protein